MHSLMFPSFELITSYAKNNIIACSCNSDFGCTFNRDDCLVMLAPKYLFGHIVCPEKYKKTYNQVLVKSIKLKDFTQEIHDVLMIEYL